MSIGGQIQKWKWMLMERWRQTFDTVEHHKSIAEFVAAANEQNLERLAQEVAAGRSAA